MENWKHHMPLAIAAVSVITALATCTWSIERTIERAGVSEYTVDRIHDRLDVIEQHLEAIDTSTCSMDKHFMNASETVADLARKC